MYIFGQYIGQNEIAACQYFVYQVLFLALSLAALADIIPCGSLRYVVELLQSSIQVIYSIAFTAFNPQLGIFLIIITVIFLILQIIVLAQESSKIHQREYTIVTLRPKEYEIYVEKGVQDIQYDLDQYEVVDGHSPKVQIRCGTNVILTSKQGINPRRDGLRLLCKYRSKGYDSLDYWNCARVMNVYRPFQIMSLVSLIITAILIGLAQFIQIIAYFGGTGIIYMSSAALVEIYKAMFLTIGYLLVRGVQRQTREFKTALTFVQAAIKWVLAFFMMLQYMIIFSM